MAFGVLLAINTECDGFEGTQLNWVSDKLHEIRNGGKWPASDLYGYFGVTALWNLTVAYEPSQN